MSVNRDYEALGSSLPLQSTEANHLTILATHIFMHPNVAPLMLE